MASLNILTFFLIAFSGSAAKVASSDCAFRKCSQNAQFQLHPPNTSPSRPSRRATYDQENGKSDIDALDEADALAEVQSQLANDIDATTLAQVSPHNFEQNISSAAKEKGNGKGNIDALVEVSPSIFEQAIASDVAANSSAIVTSLDDRPACPDGGCDQKGLANPSCSGGDCDQRNATNPRCVKGCKQQGAVNPVCLIGYNDESTDDEGCDQSKSTNPECRVNTYKGGEDAKLLWAFPPSYDGKFLHKSCDQSESSSPACYTGHCDQSNSDNPSCQGGSCDQEKAKGMVSCHSGCLQTSLNCREDESSSVCDEDPEKRKCDKGDCVTDVQEMLRKNKDCPDGGCYQVLMLNPTCDGGSCDQHKSTKATCKKGGCDQSGSFDVTCAGGRCDQSDSTRANCDPAGKCDVEDASEHKGKCEQCLHRGDEDDDSRGSATEKSLSFGFRFVSFRASFVSLGVPSLLSMFVEL